MKRIAAVCMTLILLFASLTMLAACGRDYTSGTSYYILHITATQWSGVESENTPEPKTYDYMIGDQCGEMPMPSGYASISSFHVTEITDNSIKIQFSEKFSTLGFEYSNFVVSLDGGYPEIEHDEWDTVKIVYGEQVRVYTCYIDAGTNYTLELRKPAQ